MGMNIVKLKDVSKSYGANLVVKGLNLSISEGEFLTLLGPSGCGKTTTLRMIAGFEEPTEGEIYVEGERVEEKEPYQRNVNTVFQSYALFPHMSIYDNVAYGLKMKKVKKHLIREQVLEMLSLVQLEGFEKRFPSQLSGGQKQRVAIARALINKPRVLLLDEPLGALDLKLRKQMQLELKRLQKLLGITFVYVTHDQEEALTMSDRIAVMHDGIMEQIGTPYEVYDRPQTSFVASFIGETNLFEASVASISGSTAHLHLEMGSVIAPASIFEQDEMVYLSVRPEKTRFSPQPVEDFTLAGVVKDHIYVGSVMKCVVSLQNGQEIKIEKLSGRELPQIGETIYVYWNRDDAVVIKSASNHVIDAIENVDMGGIDYDAT